MHLSKVAWKIVVCALRVNEQVEKGGIAKKAGVVGMVLVNNVASGEELLANQHFLLATMLTYIIGLKLLTYINNTYHFIRKPA